MKSKDKKLLSWKESIKITSRAYKMLIDLCPKLILSKMLIGIWDNIMPFAGIWFSAQIINELSGNRDPERLKFLVLATLITTAVMSLVAALLNKWRNIESKLNWYKVEQLYVKKILDMDYIDIDNTKTHELYTRIIDFSHSGGWVFIELSDFAKAWFSLLCVWSVKLH